MSTDEKTQTRKDAFVSKMRWQNMVLVGVLCFLSAAPFFLFFASNGGCILKIKSRCQADSTANYWSSMQNMLAVPAYFCALYVYYTSKRREARDREEALLASIESRYSEFIGICLGHPEERILNYEKPRDHSIEKCADCGNGGQATGLQKTVMDAFNNLNAKDRILGDMLLSLFQSAYFVYYCRAEHLADIEEHRVGWDDTIAEHLKNKHFLAYYCEVGKLYGNDFNAYLEHLFCENHGSAFGGYESAKGVLAKLRVQIINRPVQEPRTNSRV